jgi:uncharacterized protein YegP (UPF0339 family)
VVYRLFAFVLLVSVFATFSLDAGGGKVAPKDKGPGSIEVYKGKTGYRYRIKDADGKTIAMPLPQMHWEKKEDCLKAIEQLKNTLNKAKPTEVKD